MFDFGSKESQLRQAVLPGQILVKFLRNIFLLETTKIATTLLTEYPIIAKSFRKSLLKIWLQQLRIKNLVMFQFFYVLIN